MIPIRTATDIGQERSTGGRFWSKLLISVLVGGLLAWLATRGGVPLMPGPEHFFCVQWWVVPAYFAVYALTHFLRATRWRFLIAPVKRIEMREVIALNWVGFFAIFAFPLRIGELARPALTKARQGVSISAGLGAVAVERVLDGIITSACVVWALFALPRLEPTDQITAMLPTYGYLSLAIFTSAFIVLGMFLWQRELAVRVSKKLLGAFSPRLGAFVSSRVDNVADGLRSVGDARLAAGFLLESLAYWGLNAAGLWMLGVGCGLPMHPGHGVAVLGVLAIGIMLPTGPGLFGNFQLAISAALKLYLAEAVVGTQGAVYVFIAYTTQFLIITLAGIIPLYRMNLRLVDLLRLSQDGRSAENLALR